MNWKETRERLLSINSEFDLPLKWNWRIDLREADLVGANLREANLREANLHGANLFEADLTEADLREADLREADLRRANLTEANLYRADLRGANLYGANLSEADLRRAYLYGAYLSGANLSGANLRRAYLYGAYLYRADLTEADLSGADLTRAYLTGADLTDITVSWKSRTLIAEILWRAAGNSEQEMLAAWVARKVEWSWAEWLAAVHPERGWALSTLAEWVKDGDDAPEEFLEVVGNHRGVKEKKFDFNLNPLLPDYLGKGAEEAEIAKEAVLFANPKADVELSNGILKVVLR